MTYDYMTLEYREDHEAVDIQQIGQQMGGGGWCLKFVLPDVRVLVFERVST